MFAPNQKLPIAATFVCPPRIYKDKLLETLAPPQNTSSDMVSITILDGAESDHKQSSKKPKFASQVLKWYILLSCSHF
jgi:hypothetical protein